jgi:protein subunit release factor B
MAYGLMKDIKGYHIHVRLSSNSSIEKVMTVIRLGGASS